MCEAWADTVIRAVDTRYPWASGHMALDADDQLGPPELAHPCFYGSLDWHSSCHMQWSAIRLLPLVDPERRDALATLLNQRLTRENAAVEVEYLRRHSSFERPYGWAWLVMLAAAAHDCDHPDAEHWRVALAPLADLVAELVHDWLPRQALPVRQGTHQNTAFALALLRDGFTTLGRDDLVAAIDARAQQWFGEDRNYPSAWEPSGTDFLSPALCEADLMRRVLASQFPDWLAAFLPRLGFEGDSLLGLPPVHDVTDGHLVHLFGLGLSRASQLRQLASLLPAERAERVRRAASAQVAASSPQISDGDFMSTHWLVSFALLATDVA